MEDSVVSFGDSLCCTDRRL